MLPKTLAVSRCGAPAKRKEGERGEFAAKKVKRRRIRAEMEKRKGERVRQGVVPLFSMS